MEPHVISMLGTLMPKCYFFEGTHEGFDHSELRKDDTRPFAHNKKLAYHLQVHLVWELVLTIVWILWGMLLRIPIYVDVTQLAKTHIKEPKRKNLTWLYEDKWYSKQNILAPCNSRYYPKSIISTNVH